MSGSNRGCMSDCEQLAFVLTLPLKVLTVRDEVNILLDSYSALLWPIYAVAFTLGVETHPATGRGMAIKLATIGVVYADMAAPFMEVSEVGGCASYSLIRCLAIEGLG